MRLLTRISAMLVIFVVGALSWPETNLALGAEIGQGETNIILSVPRSMTYQGVLKNSGGEPLPDSFFDMTFRIFSQESGGAILWSQAASDTTDADGHFTITLVNLNLPFNQDYWLELEIGGQVLSPRQKVAMAGYAARSDTAGFALSVLGGSSRWTLLGSALYTNSLWGIARGGASNSLRGTATETMVNLGVSCTTGTSLTNWGYSTVGGGYHNTASHQYATISGGYHNRATAGGATVSGGVEDTASGLYAAVGGGWANVASEDAAMIPGGLENEASGACSFAAGRKAKARHDGSFVWADYNLGIDFASTAQNQFLIRAFGGVGIGTNNPTTELDVNGSIRSRSGGYEFPDGTVQPTAAIGAPIGGVIAWLKTMTNTPALPPEFVECNGQVLADPDSPYNGQTIPNLNSGHRFLRGGTASGGTGGNENHDHEVDVDSWSIVSAALPTHYVANTGVYTSESASSLPLYYNVVWVMRVK